MVVESISSTNRIVATESISSALSYLLGFLRNFSNAVLVGHNILNFDANILLHALEKTEMLVDFKSIVHGFTDSLHMFKLRHPGMDSYSQENLVKALLHEEYSAHEAVEDTAMLEKLCTDVSSNEKLESSATVSCIIDKYKYCQMK